MKSELKTINEVSINVTPLRYAYVENLVLDYEGPVEATLAVSLEERISNKGGDNILQGPTEDIKMQARMTPDSSLDVQHFELAD